MEGMARGPGQLNNSHGVTLIELMIATAISGVAAIALMTVMADFSRRTAAARNDANLSEQLVGFSDLLETYLGNATLIDEVAPGQTCGCGMTAAQKAACLIKNAADCVVTAANPTPNCSAPILRFEFEDTNFPDQQAAGNCVFGAGIFPGGSPDGLVPRGCKRKARLVFTPPVANSGTGAGILAITLEDVNGIPAANPFFGITGVTSFRCGHLENPSRPGMASPDSFRLVIGMKARANNFGPGHPEFDGWHPDDARFVRGTHRTITADINFRNLTASGIHFGKAESIKNCVIDGQVSPEGQCCSGYWNSTTNVCIAANACLPRNAALVGIGQECCSRMSANGVCR